MSDELHSTDELEEQLDSNRRKKVKNFKLNINADDVDDIDDDIDIPESFGSYGGESLMPPSRDDDDIILPDIKDDDDYYRSEKEEEKRRKKALKAERKRKKKKAKRNGCVFKVVWLVMVVILGVFLAEFLLVGINDLLGRNRGEEETVIIQIPKDATLEEVTEILADNGVISNPNYFKLYANITKSSLEFTQGSYEMENNMDYEAIINYLQSNNNRVDTVTLQFNEGMTVLEIAEVLGENGICDEDEFLELCNSDEFDEDFTFLTEGRSQVSGVYYKLEGYLFPDTYDFYQGESAKTTIYRFLNNYETRIYYTKQRIEITEDATENVSDTDSDSKNTKKYEKLTVAEQAEKQGMTMDEVMIIASMIQAEAANTDDMYVISSIFHNRLATLDSGGYTIYGENINGTLGSDPTIYYPYRQNTAPSNFTSKYNTYEIEGLPAGPDCNPGMEAIKAALYPASTNYYYFCHKAATEDSDAQPYYAATLADHNYNQTLAGLN